MFKYKQIIIYILLIGTGCAGTGSSVIVFDKECESWDDQCRQAALASKSEARTKGPGRSGQAAENPVMCEPWENCSVAPSQIIPTTLVNGKAKSLNRTNVSGTKALAPVNELPTTVIVIKPSVKNEILPGRPTPLDDPDKKQTIVAKRPSAAAPKHPPAPAGSISSSAKQGSKYLIGPGDQIRIFVWRNPDVSVAVPVRPDGKISSPLVEDMVAVGKTPTQLARDIETVLQTYIRGPVVTVIVTGFGGPYSQQIRVIGQAAKPQTLPYKENMSLLDVIIAVGGLTEYASGNRATIVRTVKGKRKQMRVKINDLVKKGDINANVFMKPGDILIIPESWF